MYKFFSRLSKPAIANLDYTSPSNFQLKHCTWREVLECRVGYFEICFWAQDWSETEISIGGGALCCGCVGDLVVLHNSRVKYLGGCSNCWTGGVWLGYWEYYCSVANSKGRQKAWRSFLLWCPLWFSWVVGWGGGGGAFCVTPFRALKEFARWVCSPLMSVIGAYQFLPLEFECICQSFIQFRVVETCWEGFGFEKDSRRLSASRFWGIRVVHAWKVFVIGASMRSLTS